MKNDYKEVNKASWNKVVDEHYNSKFYDVEGFLAGKSSLNSIELDLMPQIKDKKILHLQCHFGMDSISFARLGADVTAVDFSENAIEKAKELAKLCQQDVNFIVSDVYDLPHILNEKFDYVFTSYGVIGWLPDMNKWAKVISHFLKPNGALILAEFHPVLWMFSNDFDKVVYSYFNVEEYKRPLFEVSLDKLKTTVR